MSILTERRPKYGSVFSSMDNLLEKIRNEWNFSLVYWEKAWIFHFCLIENHRRDAYFLNLSNLSRIIHYLTIGKDILSWFVQYKLVGGNELYLNI